MLAEVNAGFTVSVVRQFGQAVEQTHRDATETVGKMTQAYQGAATQQMQSGWAQLSSQHVDEIVAGCTVLSGALEVGRSGSSPTRSRRWSSWSRWQWNSWKPRRPRWKPSGPPSSDMAGELRAIFTALKKDAENALRSIGQHFGKFWSRHRQQGRRGAQSDKKPPSTISKASGTGSRPSRVSMG